MKINTYICNMDKTEEVVDKGTKIVPIGKDKSKTKAEVEKPAEVFTVSDAEALNRVISGVPLTGLSYKQYRDITRILKDLGEVLAHYRDKNQSILKEFGLETLYFNNIKTAKEKKAADKIMEEFNSDTGLDPVSFRVLPTSAVEALFNSCKDKISLQDFQLLEHYLLLAE